MARRILWSGSVTLPAPTSITVNDEIIWTSDTGRTLAGYMVGDPVAEKKTVSIKWGILTEAQMAVIKSTLVMSKSNLTITEIISMTWIHN